MNFVKRVAKLSKYESVLILLLITLFTIIVSFSINKASVWHDEGFTSMLASRNISEIWQGSARDVHPPLYYILLHFWIRIFGTTETALRSMSVLFVIGTIIVGYLFIKRYFGKLPALLGMIILCVSPMLVRYAQEARMYGMLAFILLLSTYTLLNLKENPESKNLWFLYIILMTAGLYTHYFTVFVVLVHWIYLITLEKPSKWVINKSFWLSKKWWLSNLTLFALWLPWLPSFYGQFTRGQGIGWIPKVDIYTFPKSIWQSLTYTDGMSLPIIIFWAFPVLIIGVILWVAWLYRYKVKEIRMLMLYSIITMVLVILVSIIKPIYQDRYLVFASTGFYMLIGIASSKFIRDSFWKGFSFLSVVVIVCILGITNINRQSNHNMREIGEYVNANYQSGDEIVSAELYTYFDFIYYCKNCIDKKNIFILLEPRDQTILRLNTSSSSLGRPNGYGESALIYDRAEEIYVDSLDEVKPLSGRLWLVGKPGYKKYWEDIPKNWEQLDRKEVNSSEVRLYKIKT